MTSCYTAEEVKAHNSTKDCWVIYKGKVYDVTAFLEDHPGGQEIVLEHAGEDCTNAFEDVGHSSSAYEMLKDFYIGELVESKEKASSSDSASTSCCSAKKTCESSATAADPKSCQPCQNNLPVIAAVVIVGAAIAYNAFFRK